MMDRFHMIKHPLGGSDVYDENGNQVGYTLPSVFGDGEDFYAMNGEAVGQSFDDGHGRADFLGMGNGTYGYMDREFLMGRNAWLHGNPFEKEENPGLDDLDSFDIGTGMDFGPDFGDSGLD